MTNTERPRRWIRFIVDLAWFLVVLSAHGLAQYVYWLFLSARLDFTIGLLIGNFAALVLTIALIFIFIATQAGWIGERFRRGIGYTQWMILLLAAGSALFVPPWERIAARPGTDLLYVQVASLPIESGAVMILTLWAIVAGCRVDILSSPWRLFFYWSPAILVIIFYIISINLKKIGAHAG